jgi:hypothetical protein
VSDRAIAVIPYVVAIAILVIGGAIVRTAILNWISVPPLLRRKGTSKPGATK